MALLALCAAKAPDHPVTDFLRSNASCRLCKGLSQVTAKFGRDNIDKSKVFATLENYCSRLPNKNANTMCGMILHDWFDEMWEKTNSGGDFCTSSPYCHNGSENIRPCRKILEMASRESIRRPVAKPQGILECSICEMVIGFCLENAQSAGSSVASDLIRKDCTAIPEFKDHCNILTDSMVSTLVGYLASNLHPSEICTFYSQC